MTWVAVSIVKQPLIIADKNASDVTHAEIVKDKEMYNNNWCWLNVLLPGIKVWFYPGLNIVKNIWAVSTLRWQVTIIHHFKKRIWLGLALNNHITYVTSVTTRQHH